MEQRRRAFLESVAAMGLASALPAVARSETGAQAITVLGPVPADELGVTLVHEHVLVDFIGAAQVSADRYDAAEAFQVALPHLQELSRRGCQTLIECTPAYIGRDVRLLQRLSRASGLHLITNTGYYGAADDKYVPAHAFEETAERLSERWTSEHRDGIEGTDVHPGFQKIGVDAGPLSEIDRKLVEAAARCHLRTGLSIAVHTGDGTAAMEILALLKSQRVSPSAYVWVHAQNESSRDLHVRAAEAGAFVEFDGISESGLAGSVAAVSELVERGHGAQVLVSQDAGWYHVGEEGGGDFRGYVYLFDAFLPALREAGLSEAQIRALLVDNPCRAFQLGVRRDG